MPGLFTELRQLRDQNALLRAQCDLHRQRLDAQDQHMNVQVGRILKEIEGLRDNTDVKLREILQRTVGTNISEMEKNLGQGWLAIQEKTMIIQDKKDGDLNGSDGDRNIASGVPQTRSPLRDNVMSELPLGGRAIEGMGVNEGEQPVPNFSTSETAPIPCTPTPLEARKTPCAPCASLLPTADHASTPALVPLLPLPASEPVLQRASSVPHPDESRSFPAHTISKSNPVTGKKRKMEDPSLDEGRPSESEPPQLSEPTQQKNGQREKRTVKRKK